MLFPQKINVVASARHKNPHNETVVVQNDTAVEFYVAVVGDNGQTELPEGATYTLVCLHLRKQPTEKLGTLQEDGNVMFKLTHMELSETGPVQAQVRVYHPEGGRLTSNPFIFHVAPDPTYGAEIKPEDQSIIEQVIGEGPAIIAEAKEETELSITERARLTGAVGGALSSLADDKAHALLEMSQSKDAADQSAQVALQAATNADEERDRLTLEVEGKLTEVETARTETIEATGGANAAAQKAIDEAEAARLQKEEVQQVLGAGPVASVNGETGVVTGLATQESVNQVTAQLAETVFHLEDITMNVRDFGAIGDGVADDTIPIENALKSGNNIIFNGTYRITRQINASYSKSVKLYSEYGSSIVLDSPVHIGQMFNFIVTGGEILVSGLKFYGNKMVNTPLLIRNENADMNSNTLPSIEINKCYFEKAKKLQVFMGGSGIYIRGAFEETKILNTKVIDCEMPEGEGIPGVNGVAGIYITQTSGRHTKSAILDNVTIERIYSSDLSYEADQDGISCLTPMGVRSFLRVSNSTFKNCYGRSIKSQFFNARITKCDFYRNEGFLSKRGNGEIDLQRGGSVKGCSFHYENGYRTGCVSTGSGAGITPRVSIKDCDVFLDDNTVLSHFASTYPRDGFMGNVYISDVSIEGTCNRFFEYRVNGSANRATVSNIRIKDMVQGDDSNFSFVNVVSSGSTSPYAANLVIHDCVNEGTNQPHIVSCRVPGVQANARVSAYQNHGFIDDITSPDATNSPLKGRPSMSIGRISPKDETGANGFYEIMTKALPPNETTEFIIKNTAGNLINLVFNTNINSVALFYSYRNLTNVLFKGSSVEVLNSPPESFSSLFTVWSTDNKLFIHNSNNATRVVTLSMLSST